MAIDVEILGGVRTPIGAFGGSLRPISAVELGARVIREAVRVAGIDPSTVDLAIIGHARQAGNGPNPGRLMSVAGGLPETVPAYTVQQACLSGMLAVISGVQAIRNGDASVVVAGGAESMSNIPHLAFNVRWGKRLGGVELIDAMFKDGFIDPLTGEHMGALCDRLAERYGIERSAQDAFALRSQRLWAESQSSGADAAIVRPVPAPPGDGRAYVLERDEHPRPDTTLERLSRLPPVFAENGTVSAGNACGIADGAAAVVLARSDVAERLGARRRARILAGAVAAVSPADYGIGPVASTRKLLKAIDMRIDDFDFVEMNEAFAAQVLACERDLGIDEAKLNVWGGAIALGHPIGMSGVRIVLNVVHQLETLGGRRGLATICGNGGHGASLAVECTA